MLTPPDKYEVKETKTGIYWIEDDGILVSVPFKDAPKLSIEESKQQMLDFMEEFQNQKFCMLMDAHVNQQTSKEEREFSDEWLPKVVLALAVIVYNPLGKMMVNMYLGLKPPPYPLKMFGPNEVEKAKDWLRTYL